jgi:hypothetical protein
MWKCADQELEKQIRKFCMYSAPTSNGYRKSIKAVKTTEESRTKVN